MPRPRQPAIRSAELDELIEEATVDCYNESEQVTGLFTMIEEHLDLPFQATVLGMPVTVASVDITTRGSGSFAGARRARRRPEAVVLSYERYLKLVGGRERVAAALEQQAREAGEALDAEAATELANRELHAMRRKRRVSKR